MKTVSVVMGTYNGAKFIDEQIDSLLNQTFKPHEIIICDDQSTDATFKIVSQLASQSSVPILLHRNAHRLGFEDNFIKAANLATGELVAFCDQDDIWFPDKLHVVARHFDSKDVSLCVHTAITIDETGLELDKFSQGITADRVNDPLSYSPWFTYFGFSMTFRRALLDILPHEQRGIDFISGHDHLAHDRWIMFLANISGKTVELAQPLVGYRQHSSNVFGAKGKRKPPVNGDNLFENFAKYYAFMANKREIIDNLPDEKSEIFPLLNKENIMTYIEMASMNLEARSKIYRSRRRISATRNLIIASLGGHFKEVPSGNFIRRDFLKDLGYVVTNTRWSRELASRQ